MLKADDVVRLIKMQFKLHERVSASWNRSYLKYIEALKIHTSDLRVADITCGRGERLNFLRDHNLHVVGADTDKDFVVACLENQISVENIGPEDFLRKSERESFDIIFMSNFEKSFTIHELSKIYELGLSALKSDSLFIMEISDQWHMIEDIKLHPSWRSSEAIKVLALLPTTIGFSRTHIEPLSVNAGSSESGRRNGYAIVAQKSDNKGYTHPLLDQIFHEPQPLEIIDPNLNKSTREVHLEQEIEALQKLVHEMKMSSSWRITAPLRKFSAFLQLSKRRGRVLIGKMRKVPELRHKYSKQIQSVVALYLRKSASSPQIRRVLSFIGHFVPQSVKEEIRNRYFSPRTESYFLRRTLPPTARGEYIFMSLKATIESKKGS